MKLKEEQQRVINHDDGNIMVSASAGSGKTTAMISRIVRLIAENKATVREIMAVTFTEKSAQDMKNKLKKAIIEKVNEGRLDLAEQLNDVAVAEISTLHSFSSRIVRNYFYIVGISPDYKILEKTRADGYKRECLDRVMRDLYEKKDESFLTLVDRYATNRKDDKLRELILRIYEKNQAEADTEIYRHKMEELYSKAGLIWTLEEYKGFLDKELRDIESEIKECEAFFAEQDMPKFKSFCSQILGDISDIISGDLYAVKKYADYSVKFVGGERRTDDVVKEYKEQLSNARDKVKDIVNRFNENLTNYETDLLSVEGLRQTTRTLFDIVKAFGEEYARSKMDDNVLDFDDLQRLALVVLEDKTAQESIKAKYKYVFVDEYQDINNIQEEIIKRIANDNLFMVGDAKQSIYGFRGCRPEIFEEKFKMMENGGQRTERLNYNFRCADNVIKFVNSIFAYCMTDEAYGASYVKNSMLISGGTYEKEMTGRACLHMIPRASAVREKEEPRIYNILEEAKKPYQKECSNVSKQVAEIIRRELNQTYYDDKEKKEKRVGFGDIAVLTRKRENAYVKGLVADLIRQGVPVSSEVSQDICDYYEAQILINLLKLVECFAQSVPLAVVMKSPIGDFTDEELAEITLNYADNNGKGEFYDAYKYTLENESCTLNKKVANFNAYLEELRFRADYLGAKEMLEKAVSDSRFIERMLCQINGKEKEKRIRRFISLAELDGASLTVSEMLDRIERNAKEFTITESSEAETVKVMTIHASKGLEFPVVIVCGVEQAMHSEKSSEPILFDNQLGFAVQQFDDVNRTFKESPLRGLIRERNKIATMKEEMRLLYVGLTRAKYSLHVTCENNKDRRATKFKGASSFIDYIPSELPISTPLEINDVFVQAREVRKVLIGRADDAKVDAIKRDFSYAYPFVSDTVLPLKTSVTAVNLLNKAVAKNADVSAQNPTVFIENEKMDGKNYFDNTRGTSRESGIVAHSLLQNFDFNGESLLVQSRSMIERGLVTKEEVESVDLARIQSAINCFPLNSVGDKTLYREQIFLVSVPAKMIMDTTSDEEVVVQGIIDLLVLDGDNAMIVDYKYSHLPPDKLKEHYKMQLDLYAYAVEKGLGKRVKSKTLVNIYNGQVVEIV